MYSVLVSSSEYLTREVCFKKVFDWIKDAFAEAGITDVKIDDGSAVGADALRIEKPCIISKFLSGDGIKLPAGWPTIAGGCLPVSSPQELQAARRELTRAIVEAHAANGVDIVDPASTFIGPDVTIAAGVTIFPGVVMRGRVSIAEGCEVGPFTHIRPDVRLAEGVKIGAFVELKNSTLGAKTGAHHLTYVGDSDVGARVNFGCGTVTVNYDGIKKFRTTIGDDAFIGCNTNLVAPVTVGAGAYTAAGSTITDEVPSESLGIARARQVNKTGWKSPKKRRLEEK